MNPSMVMNVLRRGAWIRSWLFDGAVTALVAALAVLEQRLPWPIKACGLLMALMLIWRRHIPMIVLTAVYLLAPVHLLFYSHIMMFDVAVLIAMYSVVLYRPQLRWGAVAGACAGVGVLIAAFVENQRSSNFWVIVWVVGAVTVATWVTAYGVRTRQLYVKTLEERAATLERERDHLALLAVADERAAIAREVHDVVAHSLSVMIVQADAAGYTLDGPQKPAREALSAIASTGREALEDMSRVVQLLRGTPPPPREVPPSGAVPDGAAPSGAEHRSGPPAKSQPGADDLASVAPGSNSSGATGSALLGNVALRTGASDSLTPGNSTSLNLADDIVVVGGSPGGGSPGGGSPGGGSPGGGSPGGGSPGGGSPGGGSSSIQLGDNWLGGGALGGAPIGSTGGNSAGRAVTRDGGVPRSSAIGGSPADGDGRRRVGLAELDGLIQRSGLRVIRETVGTPGGLGAALELITYRIVQESLTNALRHAGADAAVTLRLAFTPQAVRIEVSDDGGGKRRPSTAAADRPGHGLVGMRERVAMHGGELAVGPRPGGGWRVAATIPRTSGGAVWTE